MLLSYINELTRPLSVTNRTSWGTPSRSEVKRRKWLDLSHIFFASFVLHQGCSFEIHYSTGGGVVNCQRFRRCSKTLIEMLSRQVKARNWEPGMGSRGCGLPGPAMYKGQLESIRAIVRSRTSRRICRFGRALKTSRKHTHTSCEIRWTSHETIRTLNKNRKSLSDLRRCKKKSLSALIPDTGRVRLSSRRRER